MCVIGISKGMAGVFQYAMKSDPWQRDRSILEHDCVSCSFGGGLAHGLRR